MTSPAGNMLWGVDKQVKYCDIMILMIPLSLIAGPKKEGNFVKLGVEWWKIHLILRTIMLKNHAFSDIKAWSLLGHVKESKLYGKSSFRISKNYVADWIYIIVYSMRF